MFAHADRNEPMLARTPSCSVRYWRPLSRSPFFSHTEGIEFVAYVGELTDIGLTDALQRAHETSGFVGLGETRDATSSLIRGE